MIERSAAPGGQRPLLGLIGTVRLFCADVDATADVHHDVPHLPEDFREPEAALRQATS